MSLDAADKHANTRLLHARESRHSRIGKKRFPAARTLARSRMVVPCLELAGGLPRSSAVLPIYFPIPLHLGLRRPRIMAGRQWIVSVSKQFAAYKTCFYPPCACRRCTSRTFRRTPCLTNPHSLAHSHSLPLTTPTSSSSIQNNDPSKIFSLAPVICASAR